MATSAAVRSERLLIVAADAARPQQQRRPSYKGPSALESTPRGARRDCNRWSRKRAEEGLGCVSGTIGVAAAVYGRSAWRRAGPSLLFRGQDRLACCHVTHSSPPRTATPCSTPAPDPNTGEV